MAGCIQFCSCQDVSQGVIVGVHGEVVTIEIFVELVCDCPAECQELEFVCRVVLLCPADTSAGIGNHSVLSFLFLVEYGSQSITTGICVDCEGKTVVSICKDGWIHQGFLELPKSRFLLNTPFPLWRFR